MCERAAQWVVDAFAALGLDHVAKSPTPDGSMAVHGSAPAPDVRIEDIVTVTGDGAAD